MGCHGNGEITYSWNEFIHGNKNSSYTVDPREQFGTHENLSWGGCMVGPTGPRPTWPSLPKKHYNGLKKD